MPAPSPDHILWVDLETTGLDAESDQILEVAAIVTDRNLDAVAAYGSVIRPHGDLDGVLAAMPNFVQNMHETSGLARDLRRADRSIADYDALLADKIRAAVGSGPFVLGGNSVSFDRGFIEMHMPRLAKLLHYRTFDVRTVQMLMELSDAADAYRADLQQAEEAATVHRAMDDIRLSIQRARAAIDLIHSPRGGR